MKLILSILLILLSFQSYSFDTVRGDLLKSLNNKKVELFINSIYSEAEEVCKKYNIPIGLLIAEACLRSDFGDQKDIMQKNNLLKIQYEGVDLEFDSIVQCFELWASTLNKSCFHDLSFKTINGYIYQYSYCGFASSIKHVRKLKLIVRKYKLNHVLRPI